MFQYKQFRCYRSCILKSNRQNKKGKLETILKFITFCVCSLFFPPTALINSTVSTHYEIVRDVVPVFALHVVSLHQSNPQSTCRLKDWKYWSILEIFVFKFSLTWVSQGSVAVWVMMTLFAGRTKSVNSLFGGCANHSSREMILKTFPSSKSEPEKVASVLRKAF